MLLRKIIMKLHKYLLSYGFTHKTGDNLQYTEGGTGRIIMELTRKIKTSNDVYEVEEFIKQQVKDQIDNLESISLYSFDRLH